MNPALAAFIIIAIGAYIFAKRNEGTVGSASAIVNEAASSLDSLTGQGITPIQTTAFNTATGIGGIDPVQVMAICEIESNWNPSASLYEPASGDTSYGLMQVESLTAADRGFTIDQLLDPVANVQCGCAQLLWIASYLGTNDTTDVVGAYNAGVGNIVAGKIPAGYLSSYNIAYNKWALKLNAAGV